MDEIEEVHIEIAFERIWEQFIKHNYTFYEAGEVLGRLLVESFLGSKIQIDEVDDFLKNIREYYLELVDKP